MSAASAVRPDADANRPQSVLIVGAGFGGIAAAIECKRHGIDDVTILERAPSLGGTWHYNSYPGAACDVPSHLYSFSFAQRRDWTRLCSPQPEISDYLRRTAREYDVERHIELGRAVASCTWDERDARWRVQTEQGERYEADALVLATGQLNQPALPPIDGIETFAGRSFHSARWEHDYRLAGKRVAVVGTGASAVQFVPEVAEQAARLSVFQRTGNWMLPRRNRRYPPLVRAAIERVPGVQTFRRRFMFQYCETITAAIRHPRTIGRIAGLCSAAFMRSQVKDPELRRKVWPDYTFGCKRVLFSSQYLPTLARANVELVTDAIERVTPTGIVTVDGRLHDVDCIIWGTGFKTTQFMLPMRVVGANGAELADAWREGAHAHLGVTVPGFPNMFVLYGPNTNTSGGSIIVYLEAQASYLRQALQQMRVRGAASVEVRAEVERASDRELQARFAGTAWTRCDSWYRDERGRIVANWPGYMREYLARTRELDPGEYRFSPRMEPVAEQNGDRTLAATATVHEAPLADTARG
ncbi:MAG TPA: NAD(P)/FAD-dependent oxidoreductase [Solirubrobacteraceae bacterium]|jgi:cation diffusion facilitator CzcD-associated flavoprotein CzcO|nr:NAD(P)/FAD-dependent oxidoreductase [Solirubrobacteraceae bacterium]